MRKDEQEASAKPWLPSGLSCFVKDHRFVFPYFSFTHQFSIMSISYEEALETLQSMFGDKWTRDGLDTVLRHHQGHMENTVDMILRHGDGSPEALLKQIEEGIDPRAQTAAMDEALARQLSQPGRASSTTTAGSSGSSQKKGRGTPTVLPDDFLRLPNGMNVPSNQMSDDEALARML